MEATVPACSALMDCSGVQIREVGRRPRNNLASADTKPGPSDPAGLHGGCTESGLISGTRPNELITGLSFAGFACDIPFQRGRGSTLHLPAERRGAWCGGGLWGTGGQLRRQSALSCPGRGPISARSSFPGVLCVCPSGSVQGIRVRSPLQPTLARPCCGTESLLEQQR